MILIACSASREATSFATLFDHLHWACQICGSVADLPFTMARTLPRVILVRHELTDGYSDDILAHIRENALWHSVKVIVLMRADSASTSEARQVSLGADCVLRDPLRFDVLLAYLDRFRNLPAPADATPATTDSFPFAGATVYPHEFRVSRGDQTIHIAPQETNLLRLLARTPSKVVSYPTLYGELFSRRFTGETANCRVLLGKVVGSFSRVGIALRHYVEVIPKSGYRYAPEGDVGGTMTPSRPSAETEGSVRSRAQRDNG